jgi:hypothetical protein
VCLSCTHSGAADLGVNEEIGMSWVTCVERVDDIA